MHTQFSGKCLSREFESILHTDTHTHTRTLISCKARTNHKTHKHEHFNIINFNKTTFFSLSFPIMIIRIPEKIIILGPGDRLVWVVHICVRQNAGHWTTFMSVCLF